MIDRFDYEKNICDYSDSNWCVLIKYKRCVQCSRLKDGSKVCDLITHNDLFKE